MGWMADAHLYAETAMLNFDMAAFYTNFLRNINDIQDPMEPSPTPCRTSTASGRPIRLGRRLPAHRLVRLSIPGRPPHLEQHYDGVKAWTTTSVVAARTAS